MPRKSSIETRTPTKKRLTKEARRVQLLETARAIVREEGTDALTLGRLASRAGVTKPIAYEHFTTRAGLLMALAKHIDAQQIELLREALRRTAPRLDEVARAASRAYIQCYVTVGAEWNAIVAALKGDEAMEAFQRELIDNYVAIFRRALGPLTSLPPRELEVRCVGILGAADAIAREMLRGNLDPAAAARAVTALITSWLGSPPRRASRASA